jgi:CO/xanthine dehydrogenase Mo-binding subunit
VDGQAFATGETVHGCHWHELLDEAARSIGWDPAAPPRRDGTRVRAKGLSCVIKGTATPSTSTASIKLNEDGSFDIQAGSIEMGQGVKTALVILAAEELGLPVGRGHVADVDTDVTPYDQGTSSSRSTHAMGSAVRAAARDLRAQLLERAAQLLEASADDLEIADGRVRIKGAPERALDFGAIVRRARAGNLLGRGRFQSQGGLDPETGQGIGSEHWHQAAGAAEVEVDLETGKVAVLRYHAGVYTGRVINPVQAELQTEGSVAFGLGQALFEELVFDNGQLQNGNLGDYMIASGPDLPRIQVHALEHPEAREVHGIGEVSLPAVMPAVGNAVYRATGVRITDLPITPEKVLRGLRSSEQHGERAQEV